ncbi:alpha-glucosidase [Aspergillus clavatus NRRL 1]|uniref:Alpha-amylase n=1 Tax=Aspergillus clavatus (strain ATCC 1007 / CBS 513.65 / DSM 816 / NCTC 3887 / NRRL 1 / QM 1276 / 107) TaxID=344612 RepID=A1C6K4_ASPCL|nr:alpha-amylase [Aspergillus clavatus NRRL 1]EAW14025.1 alpha-amylase [Aspergillus clavatus NRRL 1]
MDNENTRGYDTADGCAGDADALDKLRWWQKASIYQVLIQSFQDSDGDGKGDIRGLVDRLDYFVALGVDVVWVSPIYESPMQDMGYDISNYRKVNPIFGTMEDLELLINETHDRGLKLILDIALNHTATEHEWFQTSRRARKDPSLGKRDWYFWSEGKRDESGNRIPPNNWESTFTGSTWELDEVADEFYLHIFGKNQPDLNWDCEEVRKELYSVLRFWLDKGVDGFRLDTMNLVSKTSSFPDAPIAKPGSIWQPANHLFANGPHIHEYLQEMYEEVLSHYDCMTLAEMSCGVSPAEAVRYTSQFNSRPELNLIIQFQHVELDCHDGDKWMLREWELPELKRIINEWQETLIDNGGWNTVWMENHDQPRGISRFTTNSPRFRALCAKMLALWQFTLQGTNLIFQGQELGMINPGLFSEELNRDIETVQYWRTSGSEAPQKLELAKKAIIQKGRDNTRIPIPWTEDPHGGFTAPTAEPWLPGFDHGREWCHAIQQHSPESVWTFYRSVIHMRKSNPTLYCGSYECLDVENPIIWAYKRRSKHKCYLVVLNFCGCASSWNYANHGVDLTTSRLLISNHMTSEASSTPDLIFLRPFEGRLYQL